MERCAPARTHLVRARTAARGASVTNPASARGRGGLARGARARFSTAPAYINLIY
jgi:hypothetical protein